MKTIQVSDKQYDFLVEMSKEMNVQDCVGTEHPVYCVFHKRKIVVDGDYDNDGWAWVCSDNDYQEIDSSEVKGFLEETIADEGVYHHDKLVEDEEILKRANDYIHDGQDDWDEETVMDALGFKKIYTKEIDIFVSAFFTMKAAKTHIEMNHYHYSKPYVYVTSGWRNFEMQMVQEVLKQITNGKSISE